MKKILVSLALLSAVTVVKAETWVMPNQGGGEITLTAQACKVDGGRYESLRHAYSWTNQIYFEGCWSLIDGNIHIIWVHSDGTRNRRVYSLNSFSKKGEANGSGNYRY
jgi:hypothetical protein